MHAASQSKIFFSLSFFLSFLSFLTLSCLGQKALWTCYACNLISVSSIFIYIFCGLRIMGNGYGSGVMMKTMGKEKYTPNTNAKGRNGKKKRETKRQKEMTRNLTSAPCLSSLTPHPLENRPQNASATKMKNSILIPSLCTIVCLIENVVGIACT